METLEEKEYNQDQIDQSKSEYPDWYTERDIEEDKHYREVMRKEWEQEIYKQADEEEDRILSE
jgi:hypothetical protein